MTPILANYVVSVSELRKNPSQLLADSEGQTIALLNHNAPIAYIISPERYAKFLEVLEDLELTALVKKRLTSGEDPIEVDLNDL